MVNAVFANELGAFVAVIFIDADDAFRQRHTELARFIVLERHEHIHFTFVAHFQRAGVRAVVIPAAAALQAVFFLHWHLCGGKQRHLFVLVVFQGGRAVKGIEVVFKEVFFTHRRSRFLNRHRRHARMVIKTEVFFLGARHITGHELQGGIFISGATLVIQRYPAGEVEGFFIIREAGDVIGFPAKTLTEVGKVHALLARFIAGEINSEGRAITQVGGHIVEGEADVCRQTGFDPIGVLQDDAVVIGKNGRVFTRFFAGRRVGTDGGDAFADVFCEQRFTA